MDHYYFLCTFEGDQRRFRARSYLNGSLHLFEVEPEDRELLIRFGIKFITQPNWAFWGMQCCNPVEEHEIYESAILAGLRDFLLNKNFSTG